MIGPPRRKLEKAVRNAAANLLLMKVREACSDWPRTCSNGYSSRYAAEVAGWKAARCTAILLSASTEGLRWNNGTRSASGDWSNFSRAVER